MPAIKDWLFSAKKQLDLINVPSSKLDSEIILAYCLNKNRTYLHAHSDDFISETTLEQANSLINKRLKRVPIAYLVGHKDFYGRSFIVNNKTLIPRPESEDIIDSLKSISEQFNLANLNNKINLIDVGTGSGCLGITAKIELPYLNVTLSDISSEALKVAELNADKFNVTVKYILGNLLKNYKIKTNIIIANLPYVDNCWDRSPETEYEPSIALFADDKGMGLIKKIITQASVLLEKNGFIIIEADPTQHNEIVTCAKQNSFKLFSTTGYIKTFIKLD